MIDNSSGPESLSPSARQRCPCPCLMAFLWFFNYCVNYCVLSTHASMKRGCARVSERASPASLISWDTRWITRMILGCESRLSRNTRARRWLGYPCSHANPLVKVSAKNREQSIEMGEKMSRIRQTKRRNSHADHYKYYWSKNFDISLVVYKSCSNFYELVSLYIRNIDTFFFLLNITVSR